MLVSLAAIGVLVAVRVTGDRDEADDGGGETAATAPASTTPGEVLPPTTAPVEVPLPDPPSKVTAEQLAGLAFTDVTKEAGLDAPQSSKDLTADVAMTSGAAVADVDGDNLPDIYVTRVGLPNSLYRNDGDGTFTDVAAASGVDRPGDRDGVRGSGGAAFADVNADDCPDLYVAGAGDGSRTGDGALLINDCSGRFTDETAERGVALPATTANLGAQGHGVTFGDYDHDGDLDLLVLHWDPAFLGGNAATRAYEAVPQPTSLCERTRKNWAYGADRTPAAGPNRSRLFRNDGSGHFTDATATAGLPLDHLAAFTADFVDMDGDGWEDLLIAADFCTSRLYHNEHGTFRDVTDSVGVGTDENGMGMAVRDVNGDGAPDWFVTSIDLRTKSGACATRTGNTGCSGNRLFVNRGDGRFDDATDAAGLRNGWWGWGAAIEDFGDDGRLEVAQANGYFGDEQPRASFATDPLRFWVPVGTGRGKVPKFAEAASKVGLDDTSVSHALVPLDYDGDGDLDLFVASSRVAPKLYRNDRAADRRWVTVRLEDSSRPGNRRGLGSKVRVTTASGREVTGWISTGGSYESQRLPELHVGLGKDSGPVQVDVWWPGESTPQTVADVTTKQVVTITRG